MGKHVKIVFSLNYSVLIFTLLYRQITVQNCNNCGRPLRLLLWLLFRSFRCTASCFGKSLYTVLLAFEVWIAGRTCATKNHFKLKRTLSHKYKIVIGIAGHQVRFVHRAFASSGASVWMCEAVWALRWYVHHRLFVSKNANKNNNAWIFN